MKRKSKTRRNSRQLNAKLLAGGTAPAVTLTATGFGDAQSNGVLTVIGTFNGVPLYQTAGGDYVFLTTDPVSPGWRIGANDPTVDETPVKYSTGTASITDPWIVYVAGTAPAGTVSGGTA